MLKMFMCFFYSLSKQLGRCRSDRGGGGLIGDSMGKVKGFIVQSFLGSSICGAPQTLRFGIPPTQTGP